MVNIAPLLAERLPAAHVSLLARVSRAAERLGVRAFLVGGTVRDVLLGFRPPGPDLDLTAVGGGQDIGLALAVEAGGTVVARSQFGTTQVEVAGVRVDIAMARHERYARPGALPSVAPGTLAEDLARRDFSVNAMAVCLGTEGAWGDLVDPHGGQGDLERRLIRVLHAGSFVDDPTRIFRAVRYAGRLGFELEPQTRALAEAALVHVDALTGDRVRHELERIFQEDAAAEILAAAARLGALAAIHPDLDPGEGALTRLGRVEPGEREDRDLLFACALTFSASDQGRRRIAARLAADGRWRRALEDMGAVAGAMDRLSRPAIRPSTIHALLSSRHPAPVRACALLAGDPVAAANLRRYLDELRSVTPMLGGHDLISLGVTEGPDVGSVLKELLKARLDGLVATREDEERLVAGILRRRQG